MAPKYSAFLVMALIVFSSAYPLAQAQLGGIEIPLVNQTIQFLNRILAPFLGIIRRINIAGTLTCPGTSQPIPRALVSLNCTTLLGGTAILGQSNTTANGSFNITVPNISGVISPRFPFPCNVTTNLPINQTICPLLNTVNGTANGVATTLTSALQAVNLTTNGLTGALNLAPSVFLNANT